MKNQYCKGFFTLLGLVLALLITCILWYMLFNIYFNNSLVEIEGDAEFSVPQRGSSVRKYKSTVDRTRDKIKSINKQQLDQFKQIEGFN